MKVIFKEILQPEAYNEMEIEENNDSIHFMSASEDVIIEQVSISPDKQVIQLLTNVETTLVQSEQNTSINWLILKD